MEVCLNKNLSNTLAVVAIASCLSCTTLSQPTLVSPSKGEMLLSSTPTFTWNPVPSARSYIIEISKGEDFLEMTDTVIFDDTSFTLADTLELGATYYWRASARSAQGEQGEPSVSESFRVQTGVEPLTPLPQDSTAKPVFSWKPYTGAESYKFTLSRYADFRQISLDTIIGGTSLELADSLAPATHFWRVQAVSAGQALSAPSVVKRIVGYKLEDTYFSISAGQKWNFEYTLGNGEYNMSSKVLDTLEWNVTDKVISVESTYLSEGRLFYCLSDTLTDIGYAVAIEDDTLFSPHYTLGNIYPAVSIFRTWNDSLFSVFWSQDTLILEDRQGDSNAGSFDLSVSKRLPGKGLILQQYYKERIIQDSQSDTVRRSWEITQLKLIP